jgi:16S rRNA (guanine1207-N2)-methyltransferase
VALADQRPEAKILSFYLDLAQSEFVRTTQAAGIPAIETVCAADLPAGPFDLFLLPFPAHGDTELARELLEQGAEVVRTGGLVAAAAETAADGHLQSEMKKLFTRIQHHPFKREGSVYVATKTAPLKKRRDFRHEFAFRDQGRLIQAVSRPGLQTHRKMAANLRPLLDAMEVRAGERVLNIGCDAGVIALAAAFRAEGVHVVAVDSNPRAIECVLAGAGKNGLTNIEAHLTAGRWNAPRGSFDLVLACPPYHSNERIADVYIDGAVTALKPGGRVMFSSKHRVWFADELSRTFDDVEADEVRSHNIIRGVRRRH